MILLGGATDKLRANHKVSGGSRMSTPQVSATTDSVAAKDINWHAMIRNFGNQHGMSWKETLHWISNRSSLQVACEVFGVSLSPLIATRFTEADKEILTLLGDILDQEGFSIPRLMEYHRVKYTRKEQTRVGFSLTKEEYLLERAKGKSKNRIAKEQGISGPALFHWLHKWSLIEGSEEQQQINDLVGKDNITATQQTLPSNPRREHTQLAPTKTNVDLSNARSHIKMVTSLEKPSLPTPDTAAIILSTIQLSLPITSCDEVRTTSSDNGKPLEQSKQSAIHLALQMLQDAVCNAYNDLSDMLGEQVANEQIQRYVDHQVSTFLSSR